MQPLDYESRKAFTLKVEATNVRSEPNSGGPFKDTATVKIVVDDSDEPPVFSKPVYLLEVNENAPINTVIGAVTARDPDSSGSVVRYGTEYECAKYLHWADEAKALREVAEKEKKQGEKKSFLTSIKTAENRLTNGTFQDIMSCFNERLTPLHAIKSLHGRDLWRLQLLPFRQTHQRQRGKESGCVAEQLCS